MRIRSTLLALAVLAIAVAVAGCGSSDDGTGTGTTGGAPEATTSSSAPPGARATSCKGAAALGGEVRVTGVSCAIGRITVDAWRHSDRCSPTGSSRTSCKLGDLTCLGAVTDRGLAVSCAGVGRSVAFIAKPG